MTVDGSDKAAFSAQTMHNFRILYGFPPRDKAEKGKRSKKEARPPVPGFIGDFREASETYQA